MPDRTKINSFLLILICLLSAGCATTYNPATKRNEFILIDTASEVRLGEDLDKEVRKEFKILLDPDIQQRLDKIGVKIAAVSDRQDLIYQFKVIKDEELNAFTIPGGFVYVNSGLMQASTDDELAGVLAHEVGHVAAKHAVKKMQAALGYQLLMGIAIGITKQQTMAQAMDIVFNISCLGYSRQDELLADTLAVKYTKTSGFDPQALITFFEKLQAEHERKEQSYNLVFLSSHPPIEDRIMNVRREIAYLNYLPRTPEQE